MQHSGRHQHPLPGMKKNSPLPRPETELAEHRRRQLPRRMTMHLRLITRRIENRLEPEPWLRHPHLFSRTAHRPIPLFLSSPTKKAVNVSPVHGFKTSPARTSRLTFPPDTPEETSEESHCDGLPQSPPQSPWRRQSWSCRRFSAEWPSCGYSRHRVFHCGPSAY